jgi:hypothetical protein
MSWSQGLGLACPHTLTDGKNQGYVKQGFALKVLGFDAHGPPV